MGNFFEVNSKDLKNFARVSQTAGARADYVQGGGGNTSVKLGGGLMAIKASGYCLKDIRPDAAYAVLDCAALQKFYNAGAPADYEDVEKTGSSQAKAATQQIEGLAPLRPSVEAGFHSILDKFVVHSHSVYANLAACSEECVAIAKSALADADYGWGFVKYVDPGARLTFEIRDELARVTRETGKRPAVIFMQNHGVIAHADDPDECLRIHDDVNERIARAFSVTAHSFPEVNLKKNAAGLSETDTPFLAEALKSGKYDEKFFLESPLYPDQLVFLTGTFTVGKALPEDGCCVANPETGVVTFNMDEKKAQVVAETLTAVTFIVGNIAKAGYTLSTMGEAAKAFIANWESEKYRKTLAGKK